MTPFTYACLHTLLDHHGEGLKEAHPNHIKENLERFSHLGFTEEDAWCALDIINQAKVLAWVKAWNVKIDPRCYENFDQALKAASEFNGLIDRNVLERIKIMRLMDLI